ncbi:MAG: hypothetical protein ACYCOX_16020 [Acidobacteriaceae bacterium]
MITNKDVEHCIEQERRADKLTQPVKWIEVSRKRMEKFLCRWVNIATPRRKAYADGTDYDSEARNLRTAFRDMFLSEDIFRSEQFLDAPLGSAMTEKQFESAYLHQIVRFAQRLQGVWETQDERWRRKRFAHLHYWVLNFFIHPRSQWKPEDVLEAGRLFDDPLDHLLDYLGDNLSRLKVCLNPDCKHPYFLAFRGTSKFCSPVCGHYGRKETQKRYWRSKGAAKRTKATAEARRKDARKRRSKKPPVKNPTAQPKGKRNAKG